MEIVGWNKNDLSFNKRQGEKMHNIVRGFLFGFVVGIVGFGLYNNLKYTTFNKPAYNVGDCLSNGLYYEKITEIRKDHVLSEMVYITIPYILGKISAPSSVTTWIADVRYIKIALSNCEVTNGL